MHHRKSALIVIFDSHRSSEVARESSGRDGAPRAATDPVRGRGSTWQIRHRTTKIELGWINT